MISALKNIPITYQGELHDVRLVNFLVHPDEIQPLVPSTIPIRKFGDKAMISMVNVRLKKMRPDFLPAGLDFNYEHIGFRLLIEDAPLNTGTNKGIYFIKSFTDKAWITWGGRYFTDYQLEQATISWTPQQFNLQQDNLYVSYSISNQAPDPQPELKEIIGQLDRAYSVQKEHLRMVQIQREKWPLEELAVTDFKTNFFRTAEFIGAFRVPETIFYTWLPPQQLTSCAF